MKKYAIVGFGCAGYNACKAIREKDADAAIDVFSDHAEGPYNPVLTTYTAGSVIPRDAMFPFGDLKTVSKELGLNVICNAKVSAVDADGRCVVHDGKPDGPYDSILISTGASAFCPPIPGKDSDKVLMMRTKDDADRLYSMIGSKTVSSALVVGASWVGIKVAEVLSSAGIKTTLADMAEYFFPTAAYRKVGLELNRRVREKGVELMLGRGLSGIEPCGNGIRASFSDGSTAQADIAVLCIGIRANTGIADKEKIAVNRGIVVDTHMRTSAPGIYAAGDCCEGFDIQDNTHKVIGLWANAGYQGRVAGLNMAGGDEEFRGNIVHNITHFMDMDFIGLGDCRIEGKVFEFGDLAGEGIYLNVHVEGGRIAGVNILGNNRISGPVKNYFVKLLDGKQSEITDLQRGILRGEGISHSFMNKLEAAINE